MPSTGEDNVNQSQIDILCKQLRSCAWHSKLAIFENDVAEMTVSVHLVRSLAESVPLVRSRTVSVPVDRMLNGRGTKMNRL